MRYKQLLFYLFIFSYLVLLAETFGILVGLYVSLLIASFFLLMLPTLAGVFTFLSFLRRKDTLKKTIRTLSVLWVFLLVLNMVTLAFFPIMYTRTNVTMFVYHMLLVPAAGAVPVIVTGVSGVYYWLVARHTERVWLTIALSVLGFFICLAVFYFFMRSPYFAQFIISLNSNALNY